MLLTLFKLALAIAHPSRSDDWVDEQAHVGCYQSLSSDDVCGDGVVFYFEDAARDDSDT